MYFSNGRVPCTNSFVCVLDLVLLQGCLRNNKSSSLHLSQIVYKNNSIPRQFSNTKENFGGNNLKQGYCRVDFQKLSGYIVNVGGVNKRPSEAFGNIIINSIRNSFYTTVHEVPAETKLTTFA